MAFFCAIDKCSREDYDEVADFRHDRDQFLRALRDASREAKLSV